MTSLWVKIFKKFKKQLKQGYKIFGKIGKKVLIFFGDLDVFRIYLSSPAACFLIIENQSKDHRNGLPHYRSDKSRS
jgi:hypothetical protein